MQAEASPKRSASKAFARDVVINVIGNLASAAIIYLAGAAAGLIPRSPALIWTSLVVIFVGLGAILAIASQFFKDHRKTYLLASAMIMLGIVGAAAPLQPDSWYNQLDIVTYPIMGLGGIVLGVMVLTLLRRERVDPSK